MLEGITVMRRNRILVVVSSNIDNFLDVPRLPHLGESMIVNNYSRSLGGKGSNRAIALLRQKADIAFCCKLGNDSAAKYILYTYKKEGLNTELIFLDTKANTGQAFIISDDVGNSTILSYLGANSAYEKSNIQIMSNLIKSY